MGEKAVWEGLAVSETGVGPVCVWFLCVCFLKRDLLFRVWVLKRITCLWKIVRKKTVFWLFKKIVCQCLLCERALVCVAGERGREEVTGVLYYTQHTITLPYVTRVLGFHYPQCFKQRRNSVVLLILERLYRSWCIGILSATLLRAHWTGLEMLGEL